RRVVDPLGRGGALPRADAPARRPRRRRSGGRGRRGRRRRRPSRPRRRRAGARAEATGAPDRCDGPPDRARGARRAAARRTGRRPLGPRPQVGPGRTVLTGRPARYGLLMALAHEATVPAEKVRPFLRVEYDRMVELGMFHGEKVELLHGRLVRMSPQGEAHVFSVTMLNEILMPALRGRAKLRVQAPFGASDISEPEPDIAIVAPGQYLDGHPTAAHLLIEVADSSLLDDWRIKGPL